MMMGICFISLLTWNLRCDCQAIQSFIQTSLMKDALEQQNNIIPNEFSQQTQHQ